MLNHTHEFFVLFIYSELPALWLCVSRNSQMSGKLTPLLPILNFKDDCPVLLFSVLHQYPPYFTPVLPLNIAYSLYTFSSD
jgi:hypothetical protein